MAYIGNAPAAGIVNSGNILDGSINTADLADAAVTAAKLAAAAITEKLGYTPVNKAGDTITGVLNIGSGGPTLGRVNIAAGGATGVAWGSGFNIGDATSYCGFIQDTNISRWRNFGGSGYQWFNAAGSAAVMALTDGGALSASNMTFGGNQALSSGNYLSYVTKMPTSMVGYDDAVPSGTSLFQPFLVSGAGSQPTGGDGCVLAFTWVGGGYKSQIYVDIDPTNYFAVRTATSQGVWQSWRNF